MSYKRLYRHYCRYGFHGWALRVKNSPQPMLWTLRPTRREIRNLREQERNWMRPDVEIVKIKLDAEVLS